MHHRPPIYRRIHRRLTALVLMVAAFGAAATPPTGMPTGSIIAFLPDYRSGAYADSDDLARWLGDQGWVICDGKNGTPDLHNRLLLGTERPDDAGQNLGSLHHDHSVSGETARQGVREVRAREGVRHPVRFPDARHQHRIEGKTDRADNLPPSTRMLFIMKVRAKVP